MKGKINKTIKTEETNKNNNLKLKNWVNVLKNPVETINKEKQNQSWKNALLNYGLSGLIGGLIIGIALVLIFSLYPSSLGSAASLIPSNPLIMWALSLILLPIFWTVLILISSFLNNFIFWIFSKLFNGTGSYSLQYYLSSIYSAPLNIIASVLMLIPIAIASTALLIILALCSAYLLFIVLKVAHEYSNSKALLSIITPVMLLFAVLYITSLL